MTLLNLKLKLVFIGDVLPRGEEDLALCGETGEGGVYATRCADFWPGRLSVGVLLGPHSGPGGPSAAAPGHSGKGLD